MATGDQTDILTRLKALLPPTWFGDDHPFVAATLTACAQALTWCYSLYAYAVLQTRINSATGGWLDLSAYDFFGDSIKRTSGQSDASFLNTFKTNIFRERGTRQAVISVLEDLTGNTPLIIEPTRPQDCGGYGVPITGYGVAGAYGSMLMPWQCFVTAYRPTGSGVPYVAGYRTTPAGFSTPSRGKYASRTELTGITDAKIYAAIASVKMEGTVVWVRIE